MSNSSEANKSMFIVSSFWLVGTLAILFSLWVQPRFFMKISDDGLHNPTQFFFNLSRIFLAIGGGFSIVVGYFARKKGEASFVALVKKLINRLSIVAYTAHVGWLIAPLAVFILLAFLIISPNHNWDGDFAGFISQTRSIVNGTTEEYVNQNAKAMHESTLCIGPTNYPWGFPVLLIPFYAAFGLNVQGLKLITVMAYCALMILLWRSSKKRHGPLFVSIMLFMFAANPFMLMYMNTINSDTTFMFFSTLTIIVMGRMLVEKRVFISPLIDSFLLGLLIVVSTVIRANGILLLGVLFFVQLIQLICIIMNKGEQKKFAAKTFLIAALPYITYFGLLVIWESLWPQSTGYQFSRELAGVSIGAFFDHVAYYFILFRDFFSAVSGLNLPLFLLSIPVVLFGVWKTYKTYYPYLIFCVLTFLLYCYWPGTQCLRALFSILPFYTIFFISGLETLVTKEKMINPRRVWMLGISMAMLVLFFVTTLNKGILITDDVQKGIVRKGPHKQSCVTIFEYIEDNTDVNDVILFFKPRMLMLYADRLSMHIADPALVSKGDYLMVRHRNDEMLSSDVVTSLQESGKIVHQLATSDYSLYRIVK